MTTDHVSRVAVRGTGRTAAVVAAGLAWLGNEVRCRRPDVADVSAEPGLAEILLRSIRAGRLRFTGRPRGDVVFLCGDGPGPAGDLPACAVVVNTGLPPWESSTRLAEELSGADVAVASNPQDLREGAALDDFLEPGCVLIGADEPEALRRVAALYTAVSAPVVHLDLRSADLVTPAGNGFLAVKRQFFTELARLCYAVGADARSVVHCLCLDQRIDSARADRIRPGSVARLLKLAGPDPPATIRALARPRAGSRSETADDFSLPDHRPCRSTTSVASSREDPNPSCGGGGEATSPLA
ncbi:hypothetical protein GCM10011581_28200 [Saccharopolyspora subtropica]|uniref:UDP-glucose 6-dehydrogenase n=1 Tax=Saccharopolyspora thermophila TaxID=89367 RepID=A0A917NCT5_9PSEU|nr:UDP-glucose/GDP-mannose dehydrogenase family protein [Saccharopolyspora subtropica]GGI89490.1 hypothetical protein GCM10011581_28200 [Saccharopolyspora subtropica]